MSSSVVLLTSTFLAISASTFFSTVYQTSNPVVVSTLTSTASQFITDIHPTTITQPEVVMASTLAFATAVTQTLSQVISSHIPASPSPTSPTTVTSTVLSTIYPPQVTVTYYPPAPSTTTTTNIVVTQYPSTTLATPTVTVTELLFLLENGAGQVYTTITTTIPTWPSPTSPIVFVPGSSSKSNDDNNQGSNWSSWNDSQKGGLIAGVVIAFLILLGLALCILWCMRRRNVWVASDHPPTTTMPMDTMMVPQGYWGPGRHGWGLH